MVYEPLELPRCRCYAVALRSAQRSGDALFGRSSLCTPKLSRCQKSDQMRQIAVFSFATALAVLFSPSMSVTSAASSSGCPADLAAATRLILITPESMTSFRAKMQGFERQRPSEPWKVRGQQSEVVIGRNGLAWGYPFRKSCN